MLQMTATHSQVGNDGERDTRRHRIQWELTSQADKSFDEDYNQTLVSWLLHICLPNWCCFAAFR